MACIGYTGGNTWRAQLAATYANPNCASSKAGQGASRNPTLSIAQVRVRTHGKAAAIWPGRFPGDALQRRNACRRPFSAFLSFQVRAQEGCAAYVSASGCGLSAGATTITYAQLYTCSYNAGKTASLQPSVAKCLGQVIAKTDTDAQCTDTCTICQCI